MDVSEYCRAIEAHLCRKNDGHLLRIVGPSFEVVSRWAVDGVPLKVALAGIDRYFERYYRKGPRRRPVKIDFCDADVRDVFDEWRRATGAVAGTATPQSVGEEATARRRGPSLPDHIERVLLRLSSLRATGQLDEGADAMIDRVSAELDTVRRAAGGLRGDSRRAAIERLAALDEALLQHVRTTYDPAALDAIVQEADADLAAYRGSMAPDAFAAARDAARARLIRERLRLPTIRFE